MKNYYLTLGVALFLASTSALVPEISLSTTSNSVVISDLNDSGRTGSTDKRSSSSNVSIAIEDDFDIVDPLPSSASRSSSIITNRIPEQSTKASSSKWETTQHKKHKIHQHHHKETHLFWSNNDILSPSTPLPPTCEISPGTACPPVHRLLERRKEYDIRWYPSHKWASAIVMSEDERFLAIWEAISKLKHYFGGYNEPGAVMNLTFPLLTQVKHGKHPGIVSQELKDVTVSVPIPARYQMNPPLPVSSDVLLDVVEASTVFVQSFKARLWELNDRALRQRADKLMATLRNHGEAFHDRYYYLAAFTKPDNTESHVYEMWIHATRLRDPGRVKPMIASRDPPLNKVTSRTRKRLCRGVECPSFDVLRVYKFGIQKRRYFDTVLVAASTTECEFNSLSVWRGFMPLHLYKHGINSHWEVLEATRPIGIVHVRDRMTNSSTVDAQGKPAAAKTLFEAILTNTTYYRPSANDQCKHNMTVSLYLPQRFHSNPPTTGIGAPPVKINRVNDMIVYVQTVGGSILDPVRSSIEVRKFGVRLRQLGLCFRPHEYYLVIYDFMVRFHGRQNEIWFLADRCPTSSASSAEP